MVNGVDVKQCTMLALLQRITGIEGRCTVGTEMGVGKGSFDNDAH